MELETDSQNSLHDQVNRSLRAAGVPADKREVRDYVKLQDRSDAMRNYPKQETVAKKAHEAEADDQGDYLEPEDGPDEVVQKHAEEKRCEAETQRRDRQVKLAMLALLSAAESIEAVKSRRRDLSS